MTMDVLRAMAALGAVLGLIGVAALLAKRYGLGGRMPVRRGARRLALIEVLPLDTKHRLVLIRRDGTEHLLLLGGSPDVVVESGIVAQGATALTYSTASEAHDAPALP